MLKMAEAGSVKTRLAAATGADEACTTYRKLVEHQLQQLTESRVEIHYSPPSADREMRSWLGLERTYVAQVEGGFGERLSGAARHVFDLGGQAALLLAGDCPDVTAAVINSAALQLEGHDVVIGPAQDGGYYLLAMKALHPGLFEGIDWSTAVVFSQTMERVQQLGLSCHVLPELADVDDFASLKQARLTHEFLR